MVYFNLRVEDRAAFLSSSAYIVGMLTSTVFGVYPKVLPAVDPANSLTIHNASASDVRPGGRPRLVEHRHGARRRILRRHLPPVPRQTTEKETGRDKQGEKNRGGGGRGSGKRAKREAHKKGEGGGAPPPPLLGGGPGFKLLRRPGALLRGKHGGAEEGDRRRRHKTNGVLDIWAFPRRTTDKKPRGPSPRISWEGG